MIVPDAPGGIPTEREVIERISTARGDLQLQRRGPDYEVIFNGCFLMATHNGGSEAALVQLARCWVPEARRVLVGGLGVGYTLRAALDLPGVEQVTVVEIEPAVVRWNRSHLAPFNRGALGDPRVRLAVADLAEFLTGPPQPYDIIAVDTDNGPGWTVFAQNQALWNEQGLANLRRWLAPGGVLAFWSSHEAPAFEALLRDRFVRVKAHAIPATASDVADVIYLAAAEGQPTE